MGLFGNNDRLNTARYNLEQYEKTKPADYQSKYQGQIKDVMDKLENMGDLITTRMQMQPTSSTRTSTPGRQSWQTRMRRRMPPP